MERTAFETAAPVVTVTGDKKKDGQELPARLLSFF